MSFLLARAPNTSNFNSSNRSFSRGYQLRKGANYQIPELLANFFSLLVERLSPSVDPLNYSYKNQHPS